MQKPLEILFSLRTLSIHFATKNLIKYVTDL